jgi:hypothetical protein
MSSASSPVRAVLEGYVAGRVKAERVVEAVAAAYYGARGLGPGDRLRPLMDVIERAHPGVVELAAGGDRTGFTVRLAERPFPKEYEPALRTAVDAVLAGTASVGAQHAAPLRAPNPGLVARLVGAIRRFFTASA